MRCKWEVLILVSSESRVSSVGSGVVALAAPVLRFDPMLWVPLLIYVALLPVSPTMGDAKNGHSREMQERNVAVTTFDIDELVDFSGRSPCCAGSHLR